MSSTPHTNSAAWGDFDGDSYPDLYLARLMEPNILYHNVTASGGTFEDITSPPIDNDAADYVAAWA
ncbi:MAG: hypothetical protein ABIK28_08130, partial [Planctomycetota bacterium]